MVAPGSFPFHRKASFSKLEAAFKSTTKKRGRTVIFDDAVTVHSIPNRKQYSEQETNSYYLNKKDQGKIREEIREYLRRMAEGDLNENELDNELKGGLEYYTPRACYERKQRINAAVKLVVRLQKIGLHSDEEWLSQAYRNVTEYSVHHAYLRGVLDQQKYPESPPFSQIMVR